MLIADQLLYFGPQLPQSLFNLNQIRAFSIELTDNPFDMECKLGMDCRDVFIPFETMETVVHFEMRSLTDWEIKHLPRIYITDDHWDPSDRFIFPGQSCKEVEMQNIKSLTSGM